jgi:DNA polymerase III subunit epsilon
VAVEPLASSEATLTELIGPVALATPLYDVTFVVLDLETTGGSPRTDGITEIGALKVRGGEVIAQIETFVNPGVPVPPFITTLTGITEAMVAPAPPIAAILPSLLEFLHGAVIVGHNIRFDCAFLDAALQRNGYRRLANRRVDTLALARRLVRDDVTNLRLHTLATHFRTRIEPSHRAYADAAATNEVLHALLEHAATFGVLGLDDLVALPKLRVHPTTAKLALTARIPREPGIFAFRDRRGRALTVGRATNMRAEVRRYFAADEQASVPQVLRETARIDHRVCGGPLETAVRAGRAIRRLRPRLDRSSRADRAVYLRRARGRRTHLALTRAPDASDANVLGPFRSAAIARSVRRLLEPVPADTRLLDALARAADVDAAAAAGRSLAELGLLADTARTRRTVLAFAGAPRLVLEGPEGRIEICRGQIVFEGDEQPVPDVEAAVAESLLLGRWLARNARRVELVYAEGVWASELPRV